MESATTLLEARGIRKTYGPVVALTSAELNVAPGEVHALLGANGAGKSTLVKVLTGVIKADAGEIVVARSRAVQRVLAGAGRAHRPRTRFPGSGAGARPDGRAEPAPHTVEHLVRPRAPAGVEPGRRLLGTCRRRAASDAANGRSRACDGARSAAARARRDHGRAAIRPRRARVHGDARVARAWAFRSVHHAPARRGGRHLRPGDDPSRRAKRGDDRSAGERRARRSSSTCSGPRPRAPRRPPPGARGHGAGLRRGEARPSLPARVPPDRAGRGRVALPAPRRDPRRRSARRPGAGRALRRAVGDRMSRGGADPRARRAPPRATRRTTRSAARRGSCRRTGCARSCRRARSGRTSRLRGTNAAPVGPINMRDERRRIGTAIHGLQIDMRAAATGRRLSGGNQQKVTIARWLATGLPTRPSLRPDARHRRRNEAAGLRALAAARTRRRGVLFFSSRAGGVPARLRPRRHAFRRPDHGQARRPRRQTRQRCFARCTGSSRRARQRERRDRRRLTARRPSTGVGRTATRLDDRRRSCSSGARRSTGARARTSLGHLRRPVARDRRAAAGVRRHGPGDRDHLGRDRSLRRRDDAALVNVARREIHGHEPRHSTVASAATPGTFRRAILVSLLLVAFGFLAGALTGLSST